MKLQSLTPNTIDYEVVRAHIVPDRLMFTRPQKRRVESMPTLQYDASRGSSNLRVMAKVFVKDKGSLFLKNVNEFIIFISC